jgi:hypothetical protein
MQIPAFVWRARVAVLCALAGCSSLDGASSHNELLLPAAALVAVQNGYLTLPALTTALAVYVVFDPLAPNWRVREARLADDRYRLNLSMKTLHSGGDGEAHQVFARRAAQLAAQPGFASFEVVAWQEGLDSTRPFAQRVAEGEIRLVRAPAVPIAATPAARPSSGAAQVFVVPAPDAPTGDSAKARPGPAVPVPDAPTGEAVKAKPAAAVPVPEPGDAAKARPIRTEPPLGYMGL